jgi:hypothetical protein
MLHLPTMETGSDFLQDEIMTEADMAANANRNTFFILNLILAKVRNIKTYYE